MSKPVILGEKPMTMAELKEELKNVRKRDNTLNFRAEKTEEYVNQFVQLKEKEAKELFNKIDELKIPRLKEEHIVKLIDILPLTLDDVKLVLQGYTITVSKDNLKRISDVIQEFTKK